MAGSRCRVSFTDSEGILYGVDVDAESLYEAVAIAVASFREDDVSPSSRGPITEFTMCGSIAFAQKKTAGGPSNRTSATTPNTWRLPDMQRALQERAKPQPFDQQSQEQFDRNRLEIKAWKDGFFEGALAGFMLAFLVVFLVGPVAGFLLAFLLVFLAALWVKFCSRVRLTSRGPHAKK